MVTPLNFQALLWENEMDYDAQISGFLYLIIINHHTEKEKKNHDTLWCTSWALSCNSPNAVAIFQNG